MAAGLTNIQGTLALFGVFLSLGVGWTGAQMANTALRKAIFADYDKLVIPDEKVTANLTMVIDGMSYCPHKQVGLI